MAPTVVLAEGSSDIRVLQLSLEVLYPELIDFFSFFNHSDLRVDGGAKFSRKIPEGVRRSSRTISPRSGFR
jgi:hypothetical protein